MKIRSTAVGAAAAAAALAATLALHPNATASAHPADPEELNPAYNSGDFLHPNDAGYRAIAATIKRNEL